jgi:hypothetical protein
MSSVIPPPEDAEDCFDQSVEVDALAMEQALKSTAPIATAARILRLRRRWRPSPHAR